MTVVQSGKVYKIVNAKSKTLLHVPDTDEHQTQAVCWSENGTDNQRWRLESKEDHWIISNVSTGHFLSYLPESAGLENGLSVIGVASQRFEWDILPEKDAEPDIYRIFVPGAPSPGKNVDLAEFGSSADGTHVILWSPWSGVNQTWKFEEA